AGMVRMLEIGTERKRAISTLRESVRDDLKIARRGLVRADRMAHAIETREKPGIARPAGKLARRKQKLRLRPAEGLDRRQEILPRGGRSGRGRYLAGRARDRPDRL